MVASVVHRDAPVEPIAMMGPHMNRITGGSTMSDALVARRCMWAVLMATTVSATPALAEVRVGIVATHNTSSMSRSDSDSTFWYSGAGGGAVVEIDLRKDLALVSRPMFLEKGSSGLPLPGHPSSELHLRYLEIPLLVKYSAASRVAPYVTAGPSLGLRLSAESVRKEYGDDHVDAEDSTDDTKPAELSLEAGIGVGLRVRKAYGFLEGVWAWGLTDASESFGRNRGLQFRFGVSLRLGS